MRTYVEMIDYCNTVVGTIENIASGVYGNSKYSSGKNFSFELYDDGTVESMSLTDTYRYLYMSTKVDSIIPLYSHDSDQHSWYSRTSNSFSTDSYETTINIIDLSTTTVDEEWYFQQSTVLSEADLTGLYLFSLMRSRNILTCKFSHDMLYVLGKFGTDALIKYTRSNLEKDRAL